MIYYSKQDFWLVSLVVATTLLSLMFGVWIVFTSGDWQKGQELIVAGIILAAIERHFHQL